MGGTLELPKRTGPGHHLYHQFSAKLQPMKKILLIEDNQEIRENIAEILTLANYEVAGSRKR